MLGKWYTDTGKNTLDVQIVENCAVIVNYNHVHYFGGVRANGSKYTFGVGERGLVSDTYSYDDTNKLLIGARFVLARDKVTAVYSTADFSLRVVVTETKTVVVKDSKVANVAISGTLANNQIVTIDGAQYKVSGKTLTPYEEISPITGTYEGKATRGTNVEAVTMAFKNNGTGTFTLNTTVINFVWTFNQSTNKVNVTFKNGTNVGDWDLDEVFTFTFNADEKKLTGVVTQDFGAYEFAIEVAVGGLSTGGNETGGEEEQGDTGIIGSYSGTMSARSSFAITMEVRGDGTLTIAWGSTRLNYTYTFNESTNKISATMVSQEGTDGCYDEELYTFTYSDGTIRGTVSYYYGEVEYTFTVSK